MKTRKNCEVGEKGEYLNLMSEKSRRNENRRNKDANL
jgi:hypothetical protein